MTRRIKVPHSTKERFFVITLFSEFGSAWLLKKKLSAPHLSAAQMAFFAQKKTLGLELLGYKPSLYRKYFHLIMLNMVALFSKLLFSLTVTEII